MPPRHSLDRAKCSLYCRPLARDLNGQIISTFRVTSENKFLN